MAGTILVTGATGNIGRELLPSLIAKGAKVRALVRETSNVQGLWDAGVELVFGDLDRVETLEAAFSGVDKVFLLTPPNANQVSQARNGIAAAKRAGVRQLVRLSAKSLELRADSPGRVTRQHFAIEGELKASGLVYTIIRPHFFMQNTLLSAETVASEGVLYAPMEDGRVGMIDVRDIVEVATKVLTEEGHAGKTYDLSGPASVSYHDVAAGLSQALGREVRYVDVPPEAARQGIVAAGESAWIADALIEYFGAFGAGEGDFTSPDFEAVTGHAPRSFEAFARDFAEVFAAPALCA